MIWLKHSPIRRAIIFAYYIMIFINRKVVRNVPEWRNGRRERLNRLLERACGFESRLGHKLILSKVEPTTFDPLLFEYTNYLLILLCDTKDLNINVCI